VQNQVVKLTASTALGCSKTIEKSLLILPGPCDARLKIPNIFTPNGDGLNDMLRPLIQVDENQYRVIDGSDNLLNYKMQVYSRWGEIIYQSDNPEIGWDGKGYSEDVYLVVVAFKCKALDEGQLKSKEVLLKH